MEKERKEQLDNMLIDCLESSSIDIEKSDASIPVTCYYERDVMGTDRCFAYKSNSNGLRLFQIALLSDNKNVSAVALSSIDLENPYLLHDLVCTGYQIIKEEPSEIRNLKDLLQK